MNILFSLRQYHAAYWHLFHRFDWIILVVALLVVLMSFGIWAAPQKALRLQIYQEGQLYQEIDLSIKKNIEVKGPLGITRIRIEEGKARIVSDPSPRQYCVRQGWLQKLGQTAICLPNHTSIVVVGRDHQSLYDSLNY